MVYETSYDTGLKPFNHDKDRGKWSSPNDFFFACLGHAFKIDGILILPAVLFYDIGISGLIPYLLTLAVCVVPIVFIQSFLGQFSSTGFISVFRISPIFKGLGYVALALNAISLTYYAVLGAIPLFFLLYTLRPTIPWSCEGSKSWMQIYNESFSYCEYNNQTYGNYTQLEVPSIEFFDYELSTRGLYHPEHPEGTFSWFLMFCMFLIWGMVAAVITKPIDMIGKFLRYSTITVLGIIGLCIVRFIFLPGALEGLKYIILPEFFGIEALLTMPLLAFTSLGPGWGSIMTMASFNKFDTNIFRLSWVLCLAQLGMLAGVGFVTNFMFSYMTKMDPENIGFRYIHSQWQEFLTVPTGLTFLELPHIWSILYFGMIILGTLNLMVVQLLSLLTSVFDEFEQLRPLKRECTLGAIGGMALISIGFCSNYGVTVFEGLTQVSILSQTLLNFLLLIIIVWIYGRERFQRDVHFMTERTYSTWMVNILRFVAPFLLFILFLTGMGLVALHAHGTGTVLIVLMVMIPTVPWLIVPGYCVFKVLQTSGLIGTRLRRSIRPTDWYPVDPEDRRRYEERFNDTEITHNLFTDTDLVE